MGGSQIITFHFLPIPHQKQSVVENIEGKSSHRENDRMTQDTSSQDLYNDSFINQLMYNICNFLNYRIVYAERIWVIMPLKHQQDLQG